MPAAKVAGAYLTVRNRSSAPDRLIGALSPVAARVEFHVHTADGEVMRMRQAQALDIPTNGALELHLLALALDLAGVMPLGWGVYLVMTVSLTLIAIGMALLALGWAQVFGARYELMTRGIYGLVRYPQYLGLILILVAFNIQWPTLLTLLMAPLLIVAYVRQARREDAALDARFGEAFARYAARVPAFCPRFRRRSAALTFQ